MQSDECEYESTVSDHYAVPLMPGLQKERGGSIPCKVDCTDNQRCLHLFFHKLAGRGLQIYIYDTCDVVTYINFPVLRKQRKMAK